MESSYDCIIIGAGPAGLTAGIYTARARLKVLLLEKFAPGGQIQVSDLVENYPGFPEGISGAELMERMAEQAKRFELPIESSEVVSVDFSGPLKKIVLPDRQLTARTIIVATGAQPRQLGVPGENVFTGKGVSFCATCDGPFYRGKSVAAVGGGDSAVQESIFLTRFVDRVYVIHRRNELRAARILQERALANPKITFVWDSVVTEIKGDNDVNAVTVKNVKTGEVSDLAVSGCFIWVGTVPNTGFLGDSLAKNKAGFLITDQRMQTSVPGVFAAGDVRETVLRQVSTAVGDGAIAAFCAEQYVEAGK
ncbi:MAG: thioredoxin-disulfide reductase [Thermodesulfobacteriota bacterium]